jgi:hypothetical protein
MGKKEIRTIGVPLEIGELLWGEFALRFAHGGGLSGSRGVLGPGRDMGGSGWV